MAPRPYCGLRCGCYIPGDIGTRRCHLGHFDERDNSKLPMLGRAAQVLQPNVCGRGRELLKK